MLGLLPKFSLSPLLPSEEEQRQKGSLVKCLEGGRLFAYLLCCLFNPPLKASAKTKLVAVLVLHSS